MGGVTASPTQSSSLSKTVKFKRRPVVLGVTYGETGNAWHLWFIVV
jgi:hypothetical protein